MAEERGIAGNFLLQELLNALICHGGGSANFS